MVVRTTQQTAYGTYHCFHELDLGQQTPTFFGFQCDFVFATGDTFFWTLGLRRSRYYLWEVHDVNEDLSSLVGGFKNFRCRSLEIEIHVKLLQGRMPQTERC